MGLLVKKSSTPSKGDNNENSGSGNSSPSSNKPNIVDEKQESQQQPSINFSDQQRCDLIYGESGVGKTENLGLAALYVWNKYGKISRLVSADGGGWKPLQPYIDLGIIKPVSLNAINAPLSAIFAIARGRWPEMGKDGKVAYMPLDRSVIEGDEKNGIPAVGCQMFEGLTSFASSIMINLTKRKDIHIPETPKESFVKDGDEYWGFTGRAHYGFVQNRIEEMVSIINGLPFDKLVMTALEEKGNDPETGESCYGPRIIGKASTGKAPAWFGACIHLESLMSSERQDDQRDDYNKATTKGIPKRLVRAYLVNHPDPKTGIMYKAKGRVSAWTNGKLPAYFDVIINESTQKGINWVYEQEDILAANASQLIESKLTRPSPKALYAVKGQSMTGYTSSEKKEAQQDAKIADVLSALDAR